MPGHSGGTILQAVPHARALELFVRVLGVAWFHRFLAIADLRPSG